MKINQNVKRSIIGATLAGLIVLTATSCDDSSKTKAQDTEKQAQATSMNALLRDQPVPTFQYSQVRQNMIEIESAMAQGAVTTSFFMQLGSPDPIFSCPSIGAPIPASWSLTNPHQSERHGQADGGNVTIDQADPYGLYSSGTTGTYVMCVGTAGQTQATYWEGNVLTTFGPATWDKSTHQMQPSGSASFKFSAAKKP